MGSYTQAVNRKHIHTPTRRTLNIEVHRPPGIDSAAAVAVLCMSRLRHRLLAAMLLRIPDRIWIGEQAPAAAFAAADAHCSQLDPPIHPSADGEQCCAVVPACTMHKRCREMAMEGQRTRMQSQLSIVQHSTAHCAWQTV